jgi:hypothetical protein
LEDRTQGLWLRVWSVGVKIWGLGFMIKGQEVKVVGLRVYQCSELEILEHVLLVVVGFFRATALRV